VSGKHNKGWTGAYSSQVKPSVSIAKFGVAAKYGSQTCLAK